MGNTETPTASGGITKLKNNHALIIKYFEKSSLIKNYMGNRCTKILIEGKEIDQNSSFYFYNIEGFFDFEKGIYFSLIQLLESMIVLEESKVKINSYEQLEYYFPIVSKAFEFFGNLFLNKNENNANLQCNKEFKEENSHKKSCFYSEESEIKISEDYFIKILGGLVQFEKHKEQKTKTKIIKEVKEELKTSKLLKSFLSPEYDLSNPKKFFEFFRFIIETIEKLNGGTFDLSGIFIIRWLRKIIPFEELKGIINLAISVIDNAVHIAGGFQNIIKGVQNFPKNKLLSTFYIINGIFDLVRSGIQIKIICDAKKKEKIDFKKTKAQDNFLKLLSEMDKLCNNLIDSNLEDLYHNNIIILAIDESKTKYNEGVDLQLVNISKIDYYAKCLNSNDPKRVKYIKNMILFYYKLGDKLNIKETGKDESNLKQLKKNKEFISILQNTMIKEFNDKTFWINLNETDIDNIIKLMEEGYDTGKNNFINKIKKFKIQKKLNDKKDKENKTNEGKKLSSSFSGGFYYKKNILKKNSSEAAPTPVTNSNNGNFKIRKRFEIIQ